MFRACQRITVASLPVISGNSDTVISRQSLSAALLKRSVSRRAFDKAIDEGALLVSTKTIDELNQVLGRDDFAKYVTEDGRMEFLTVLLHEAKLVEVTVYVGECRDARGNQFLELAVSGKAACIVSGDQDLLVLHSFRGISIVTPRGFLDGVWKEQGQTSLRSE